MRIVYFQYYVIKERVSSEINNSLCVGEQFSLNNRCYLRIMLINSIISEILEWFALKM